MRSESPTTGPRPPGVTLRLYALLALLQTASALRPPVAKRVWHTVSFGAVHGENRGDRPMDPPRTRTDDLFWLRDDSRQSEEVLEHLRAENAFTEASTSHLAAFRSSLYEELLSHIEEDYDSSAYPAPDGFEYWSRTRKGLSFSQHWRRRIAGGADELVLDENAVASSLPNPSQCDVGEVALSPSGDRLAFSVDGSGDE
eukprot:7114401-Prymnesium_polylepis.1